MKIDYAKKQALFVKADKKLVDELLLMNTNNRNIRKRHVQWLMNAIENDEFLVTGQPIIVTSEGVLIDGQHRLMAIQKAGYPNVDLMIVTGIDPKAQMYLDQHAKRSLRDVLRLTFEKDLPGQFASLVSFMMNYNEAKDTSFTHEHARPLIQDFYDYAEKHAKRVKAMIEACGNHLRISVIAALYLFGQKYDWDEAINLALKIRDGENITRQDPAYQLREYLRRNTHGGSQASEEAFRMTVGACVAQAQGKKLERLRPLNSWQGLPK